MLGADRSDALLTIALSPAAFLHFAELFAAMQTDCYCRVPPRSGVTHMDAVLPDI